MNCTWVEIEIGLNDAWGKHNWVTFRNPRNGKVCVRACERCGMVKDRLSSIVACELVPETKHQMKKMGWKILKKRPSTFTARQLIWASMPTIFGIWMATNSMCFPLRRLLKVNFI